MSPVSADDLIARCRRVYAECETYADEGVQTTISTSPDARPSWHHQERTEFRTRWRKPDRLLFDSRKSVIGSYVAPDRCVIWSGPAGTRVWESAVPVVASADSLDLAIADATARSRGTCRLITDLLRQSVDQRTLPIEPAGFHGELNELEGRPCLVVQAHYAQPDGEPEVRSVWIGVNDMLIWRIDAKIGYSERQMTLAHERGLDKLERLLAQNPAFADPWKRAQAMESVRAQSTQQGKALHREWSIQFRPRLNVPLDDAEFEFSPPPEVV